MSNIRFIGRLVQKLLKKKENFRIFQKKKISPIFDFFQYIFTHNFRTT